MPPQIALLLCIFFILCLFTMDSRRELAVSHALWIPLIWLMITGSRLVSQWLNPAPVLSSEEAYLYGNLIDRTVFSILIVIGLLILSRRKIYWSGIIQNNAWIFLFFLYAGISILWSDFPFVSFKRWIKEIGNLVMVLVILTDADPVEAVKTLIRRCAYVLIPLSIVFIKYYPYEGRAYGPWTGEVEYMGVATSKNMLGTLCLVFGLFFFWNLFTLGHKKGEIVDKNEIFISILFLLMISWLLIKANSATSFGSLIIGVFILTALSMIRRNVRFIGVYVFFAVSIFLVLQLSFDVIGISILSLRREMTFTGRTDLWNEVIRMGTNPLIGTGYESFWLGERMTKIWENHWWQPNQAHNGYIEIYLNLGLMGLFLLTGVIVSTYRKIRKKLFYDFEFARIGMAFLIIALVYNTMEAAFKGTSLVWFIFLLIAIGVPRISYGHSQGSAGGTDFPLKHT